MAEDEYERRMKMTPMQKYRESGTKMLKGLFGGGDKAAAKPATKVAHKEVVANDDDGDDLPF